MNILVTGGAGYIGSHTCKALAKAGFTPVTYDNLSTGHKENVQWGPLVIGDGCKLGPDTYIGPYTSIGNNCTIEGCDIEYSIIMEGAQISHIGRVVDSLIGRDTEIASKSKLRPKGNRLIVGDKAQLHI